MKSLKLVVVAVSLIGIFGVGNVMAATDINTLTINANVVGTCKFIDATSTLNLGALPFDANGVSAGTSGNLNISFWCTKGVAYTIGDSSSNADNLAGLVTTTELIPYTRTLTGDTGTGNGASSPETLNVKVDIAAGDYDAVSAQDYQDVVTLSFTP